MINQEEKFYIYMLENTINKRKYIGQTKRDPEKRWCNGFSYRCIPELFSDIEKFGWVKGFRRVVLCICSTKLEALNIESYFIKKYKTKNPKYGYNKRVIKSINRKLIADIVKNCKSYEIPALVDKGRKPVRLSQNTINRILNLRNERAIYGNIITKFWTNYPDFVSFIDIGYEWYDLPHGIISYHTYKDYYTIRASIGSMYKFYKRPLTNRQIKNQLKKYKILEQVKENKDIIEQIRFCEEFYRANEKELAPFCIRKVGITYSKKNKACMFIEFLPPITAKYIRAFLGMDLEYFENHTIEVLQRLGENGTYEKFLEFGNKINWTL